VARTADPRTRPALLEAARDLFYTQGVVATAVDDVAEASGLTKPTLYRHFPSKEALVAAYLDDRHEQLDVELRSWIAGSPPGSRPRAVIDWLCDSISRAGFTGCAFVRACAELSDDRVVREKARKRKRVLLETIQDACRAAGARDPAALARQLALIVEGATTMAFVTGDLTAAMDGARELARLALAAAGLEEV
jgi:AcrR family transcriptional regulator